MKSKELKEAFAHFGRRMAEILEKKDKEITELKAKLAEAEGKVDSLFDKIKHGEPSHQEWLKNAIKEHFK